MSTLFNITTEYENGNVYVNGDAPSKLRTSKPMSHAAMLGRIPNEDGRSKLNPSSGRLTRVVIEVVNTTTPEGDTLREIAKKLGGIDSGIAFDLNDLAGKIDRRENRT